MRRLTLVVPFAGLLAMPLGGCCTMARFFCGPDTSPWVPIAYDSAEATLRTFLEAVRRNQPSVVYGCLSPGFKRQHGLDGLLVQAAWERLEAQVPGLHLLGYAEVPKEPQQRQDGGVSYELVVEGQALRIDLVRQSYWELRYRGRDGRPRETSTALDHDTLNGVVRVTDKGLDPVDELPQAEIALEPRVVLHPGTPKLRLEDVDELTVGREWKIAEIVTRQP